MEYFSLLRLQKEPFSNSPDPEMFFQSPQHQGCLQKLELAIRLRRGLSVVLGDIGTGKSTLCRQLIQMLSREDAKVRPHLILDPEFTSPLEFLATMTSTFGIAPPGEAMSEWRLKEAIKNHLFEQAVEQGRITALIIDEGQKLPDFCLELLREFLNFETNQHKLLQIVIFAQEEFQTALKGKANFADRITTFHRLRPLNLRETRAMIAFRLDRSRTEPGPRPRLFTLPAILAIYLLTQGYPRRIVMLCSKAVILILVNQRRQAGVREVLRAARELAATPLGGLKREKNSLGVMFGVGLAALALALMVTRLPVRPRRPALPRPELARAAPQPPPMARPVPIPPPAAPPPSPSPTPLPAVSPSLGNSPPPASRPPASPDILPEGPATGDTLGVLRVEPGVSLSKMVARVYGRYSPKKLALVLRHNRRLTDPNRVEPGTPVSFPVLEAPPPPATQLLLELAETHDLASAYALVRDYPETAPPLVIMPVPDAGGRVFHVVVEGNFKDAASANARRAALPAEWRDKARVVLPRTEVGGKWPEAD